MQNPHLDAARAEVRREAERLLRPKLPREQLVRRAKVKEQVLAQAAILRARGRVSSERGERPEKRGNKGRA